MTSTTSTSKRRLKILERAEEDQLPPLRPTKRDFAVLHAVYKYRALTTHQIEALLFPRSPGRPYSRRKRCQARLRLLFLHGFLFRQEQPGRPSEGRLPLVYALDKKGIEHLAVELGLEPKDVAKRSSPELTGTSFPFLRHLLLTAELRILTIRAASKHGFEIRDWQDETALREAPDRVTITGPRGGEYKVAVIPDAYFWLSTGEKDFHQFVEVDLKTVVIEYTKEENKGWSQRMKAYKVLYESGAYQKRFPHAGKSMRVLTVTLTEARMNNLMRTTQRVTGKRKSRFWFTTFDRLTPDTILTEPIWNIPGRDGLHPLVW